MKDTIRSNFEMLRPYEPQLWRLGALAERYFSEDPNTSLLKLRQQAELLAQSLAARGGLFVSQEESQYDLLRRLQGESFLPREIKGLFDQIRITGNAASHALEGDHAKALATLKLSWQLSLWFHRTFKQADFRSGPFIPPTPPADESAELKRELESLRQAVSDHLAKHEEVASDLLATRTQLSAVSEERTVWELIATESKQDKARLAINWPSFKRRPRRPRKARLCVSHPGRKSCSPGRGADASDHRSTTAPGRLGGRLRSLALQPRRATCTRPQHGHR